MGIITAIRNVTARWYGRHKQMMFCFYSKHIMHMSSSGYEYTWIPNPLNRICPISHLHSDRKGKEKRQGEGEGKNMTYHRTIQNSSGAVSRGRNIKEERNVVLNSTFVSREKAQRERTRHEKFNPDSLCRIASRRLKASTRWQFVLRTDLSTSSLFSRINPSAFDSKSSVLCSSIIPTTNYPPSLLFRLYGCSSRVAYKQIFVILQRRQ